MKTFSKSAIILALMLVLSLTAFTQKAFQGHFVYSIAYEGMEINEAMKSFLPSEMKYFIKENKTRSELKTGMGDQVTIFDGETKTSISLMDVMGQKIAVKKSVDEINLERKKYNDLQITFSDETKEIAGYTCKKAIVKVNAADFNGESSFTVFYTDALGNLSVNYGDPLFNQIN